MPIAFLNGSTEFKQKKIGHVHVKKFRVIVFAVEVVDYFDLLSADFLSVN